jgi:hypothetical protein
MMRDLAMIQVLQRRARPVELETAGQRLLEEIAPDVSLVLIGEATHGTHEFYRIRADLTRALIEHRGFTCVAAEADWPDAYRANRWVRLHGDDATAIQPRPRGRGAGTPASTCSATTSSSMDTRRICVSTARARTTAAGPAGAGGRVGPQFASG